MLLAFSNEEGDLLPHLKVKSIENKPQPFTDLFIASLCMENKIK